MNSVTHYLFATPSARDNFSTGDSIVNYHRF